MKYAKKVKKLEGRQRWFDTQPGDYQKAHTRPGSVKTR
jgi:hypothetical protein